MRGLVPPEQPQLRAGQLQACLCAGGFSSEWAMLGSDVGLFDLSGNPGLAGTLPAQLAGWGVQQVYLNSTSLSGSLPRGEQRLYRQ